MAIYVGASTVRYENLLEGELGLRFHNGGAGPHFVNADNQYFGIGCGNNTWVFNGFPGELTGCESNEYRTHPNANPLCGSEGYNDGNFSGPRICACE